ncbi:hypothetical protein ABMA57_08330 [Saccharospirillum sp. HFRX-1]|uniref:hypothetical protein n=1 Tax=unclassified Saccharospirillum TaxID=2633430 RepID=UPI003713C1C4
MTMTKGNHQKEIDHHVLRLIVGLIALLLPLFVIVLTTGNPLGSISASYHDDGAARDVFVGSLFAMAAFLFAYNGDHARQSTLSKLAAVSAVCIALFPTAGVSAPDTLATWVGVVHYLAAAVLFAVLAYFCWSFSCTAKNKGGTYREAGIRSLIYRVCLVGIGLAIVFMLAYLGFEEYLDEHFPRYIFFFEWLGLLAFGIAWLVASRIIPVITHRDERLKLTAMMK